MSQANLELVRRCNDAYNARDVAAYIDTVAESVTFRSRFSAMDRVVYRGYDAMRRYFKELDEVWSRYEMALQRMVPVGDRVVGLFHLYAVGRESDLQLEERPGVVFTIADGKIVQIDAFPTQAEALAEVGL
ncbi:MAG TPA: nuclear transport factor 2 family protein [Thermoleophilaceae bacterium]|jgi:ketosteroid isomerase-like protein|nr:nuclear transport factor 2 family protein [Thermoleophilaceae bacterium]